MTADTVEQVAVLVGPVVVDMGYELVEVQFRNEKIGLTLRVIIYKDGGITVDDCSMVSREISQLLEVEDFTDKAYHLEVTSPGLDRPLKTERDFVRNVGSKTQVRFVVDSTEQNEVGIIESVDQGDVVLSVNGVKKNISIESVKKAQLVIEF